MGSGRIKIIGTPKELKYTQLGNINATKHFRQKKETHGGAEMDISQSHISVFYTGELFRNSVRIYLHEDQKSLVTHY